MAIASSITAAIIAGGLSAGTQIYGAKKASKASKEAAAIQTQAGQRSLDFNRDIYQDTRSMMRPYTDIGGQQMYRLADMLQNRGGPRSPQDLRAMFPMERHVPGVTRDVRGGPMGRASMPLSAMAPPRPFELPPRAQGPPVPPPGAPVVIPPGAATTPGGVGAPGPDGVVGHELPPQQYY